MEYTVDLGWFITKQAPINVLFFSLIVFAGFHAAKGGKCPERLEDGALPCVGRTTLLSLDNTTIQNASDANQCCEEKMGLLFLFMKEKKGTCLVCEERAREHEWLKPLSCGNCTGQKHMLFSLPIPNRQIQCIGRSFKDLPACNLNCLKTPGPGPVYCFRHLYRNQQYTDSTSTGCPLSSVDRELAKSADECCSKRGRVAYSTEPQKWYIDEAKLQKCTPCPDNPYADVTWSEWTACSPDKRCTRERSIQIPYLEKMPKYWCMETITTTETVEESEKDKVVWITLVIVEFLTIIALAGFMCYRRFRKRIQTCLPSNAPSTKDQPTMGSTVNSNGNLIPINVYTTSPRLPSISLPEVPEEHIYEGLEYYEAMDYKSYDKPFSQTHTSYMEMK